MVDELQTIFEQNMILKQFLLFSKRILILTLVWLLIFRLALLLGTISINRLALQVIHDKKINLITPVEFLLSWETDELNIGEQITTKIDFEQCVSCYRLVGIKAIRHRLFTKARESFEYALFLEPNDYWSSLWLGLLKLKFDNTNHALSHLRFVDDSANLFSMSGNRFKQQELNDKAKQFYEIAIKVSPSFERYQALADILLDTGFNIEAGEVLLRASYHRTAPQPQRFLVQGQAYKLLGKNDEAIRAYRKAILAYPYHSDAYLELAALYAEQNEFELAQKVLLEGMDLISSPISLEVTLAGVYARSGPLDLAIAHYKHVVEQRPDYFWAHYYLVDVLIRAKQYADAEQVLDWMKSITSPETEPRVLFQRARWLNAIGQPIEAVQLLDRGLSQYPDSDILKEYLLSLCREINNKSNLPERDDFCPVVLE